MIVQPYRQYAVGQLHAGSPTPLPAGAKAPPPRGLTGAGAPMLTRAEVERFAATQPGANIGLRLPDGCIAIDVDAYDGKEGDKTLHAAEQVLGPLPRTYYVTSRGADSTSHQRLFRTQTGTRFVGDLGALFGPHVELIQHEHRYMLAAGSVHPSGRIVRAYDPDRRPLPDGAMPRPEELPVLPQAWAEALQRKPEGSRSPGRGRTSYAEAPEQPEDDTPEYDALAPEMQQRVDAYVDATVKGIQAELRSTQDWPTGRQDDDGDGWEMQAAKKALRMAGLTRATWNRLTPSEGHAAFTSAAPTDDTWTQRDLEDKWAHKVRTAKPAPWPAALDRDAPVTVETVADCGQPSSVTSTEAVSLDTCHAMFRRWLGDDYDLQPLDITLAAAAVERLDGDPVWVLLVSGSGAAKTETVAALAGAGATVTSTITSEGALLSATSRKETAKDATGGLLRKLGPRGVLVIKDFTSILSMNRDARATVLAALREVYDGHWQRNVGTDGGRTLDWAGRLAVIGAVTTAIDSAHAVMAAMGERFVLVRIDSNLGRLTAGRQALNNVGHEEQMRSELSTVVGQVLQGLQPAAATLGRDDEGALLAFADIVTLARTAVERDTRGEVVDAHAPEMPTRFAKMIGQLVRGGLALGMSRDNAHALAARAARDSVPPLRLALLADVAEHPASTTSEVQKRLQKPRTTVDRCLQELHVLGLLNVLDGLPGRPGWRYDLAPAVDRRTLADLITRNVTTPGFEDVRAVRPATDIPGDTTRPDWQAASHCPVCGYALRRGACPLCVVFDSAHPSTAQPLAG